MMVVGRLYAMEKGLKIPPKERTNETKAILVSLMNQLEKVCPCRPTGFRDASAIYFDNEAILGQLD